MIIVSSFKLIFNEIEKYFIVKTEEILNCPLCNGNLKYRDSVFRKLKNMASEAALFLIRRLLCQECNALHRELPDIIQPYKHYESSVIQAVIDGSKEALCCAADNATIRRWKAGFAGAESDINQRISSVYARMTDNTLALAATEDILDRLRNCKKRWLPFVISLLINSGHKICTEFAFFLSDDSAKVSSARKNIVERGGKNVKTIEDTS